MKMLKWVVILVLGILIGGYHLVQDRTSISAAEVMQTVEGYKIVDKNVFIKKELSTLDTTQKVSYYAIDNAYLEKETVNRLVTLFKKGSKAEHKMEVGSKILVLSDDDNTIGKFARGKYGTFLTYWTEKGDHLDGLARALRHEGVMETNIGHSEDTLDFMSKEAAIDAVQHLLKDLIGLEQSTAKIKTVTKQHHSKAMDDQKVMMAQAKKYSIVEMDPVDFYVVQIVPTIEGHPISPNAIGHGEEGYLFIPEMEISAVVTEQGIESIYISGYQQSKKSPIGDPMPLKYEEVLKAVVKKYKSVKSKTPIRIDNIELTYNPILNPIYSKTMFTPTFTFSISYDVESYGEMKLETVNEKVHFDGVTAKEIY